MLNLNSFKVIRPTKTGNYLVTIAVGELYEARFQKNALGTWEKYAEKYDLGIILFHDHLIDESHPKWKKPTWQKLIIGSVLLESGYPIKSVCYLDTDIIINPFAPNIFNYSVSNKISVVSLRNNLPFNYELTLRRLALLRNKYIDSKYPLDSSLFANLKSLYEYQNLPTQGDEFCAGLLLFNPQELAKQMEDWFYLYDKHVESITDGGDQTHLNYHVLSSNLASFLNYEFQAIWAFEAANHYPFLFIDGFKNKSLYKECIQSTLMRVNFLHFAGSWPESSTFSLDEFSLDFTYLDLYREFSNYLNINLSGRSMGKILPKKDT
ncbi:hypothetical protein EBU91_04110 [bacterium]|nr:hypothetical protein [bacterium]